MRLIKVKKKSKLDAQKNLDNINFEVGGTPQHWEFLYPSKFNFEPVSLTVPPSLSYGQSLQNCADRET